MFLNYNFSQDDSALNPTPSNIPLNGIRISNGKFTEIDLLNILYESAGVFNKNFNSPSADWTDNTIARSNFINTTNIGSISDIIGQVSQLDVQRSVHNENNWITLRSIYKTQNSSGQAELKATFTMYDTYNANNVVYDYRIVPISQNGTIGTTLTETVLSQFNKAYICDYEQIFDITKEWSLGSVQTVQKTGRYEPFGAKYPIYIANATTQYREGTTTATLLAPTSTNSGNIDRKAQVELVENFNNFLTSHKGIILKDYNGNIRVVFINDSIPNEYVKVLGNGIASTTFNWSEVTNINDEKGLNKAGMLGKFPIFYHTKN